MRKYIFFLAFVFCGLMGQTQETCKDTVYPSYSEEIIFDCCITEVKYGNVVQYRKDGKLSITPAVAITRDGQYLELPKYKNQIEKKTDPRDQVFGQDYEHDYDYYKRMFNSATMQRNFGISFVIIGLGMEVWGAVLLSDEERTRENTDIGRGLMIVGVLLVNTGIPLWISGSVKRENNKRVMDEMGKGMNLTFGTSRNGIGLLLKF